MKAIFTTILAVVALAMTSCGGMSAGIFNDTIVGIHNRTADNLNEKMELIFDHANTSKEAAQTMIDELNTIYDESITRLGEMKYPEAGAGLHKGMTDLVVYVKENVLPLFAQTLEFEPESQAWYDVWNTIDDRINGEASDLEDKMIEEQEKFAEATGQQLQ